MSALTFCGQIYKIQMNKDGGGRIIFEFGLDALEAMQGMMALQAHGEINLAVAVAPYVDRKKDGVVLE